MLVPEDCRTLGHAVVNLPPEALERADAPAAEQPAAAHRASVGGRVGRGGRDEARGRGAVEVKRAEKRVRNNRSTAGTDRTYRREEDVQENGDEARGRGVVEVKRAGKRVRGGPTGETDSARRYRREEDVQENGDVLHGGGEDAEWDKEK